MIQRRILALFLVLLMLCGCGKKEYQACVNQSVDAVARIELLHTTGTAPTVLYTLSESEFESFWSELMTVPFGRYLNDPPTEYGTLTVRITYSDGYIDMIGTDINEYLSPTGEGQPAGWFYVKEENDFVLLFSQYINMEGIIE